MEDKKFLDISWSAILKILFAVAGFYLIYSIRDLLIWIIFALIISILFNPSINFLTKRKIPRVFSVIIIYVGFFGVLSFAIYSIIPLFITEIRQFLNLLPQYIESFSPSLRLMGFETFENTEDIALTLGDTLEKMSDNIFSALFAIFGGFFSGIFVITTAFFLSLEEKMFERGMMIFFPKKYESYALSLWTRCEKKVSGWFAARIAACLFVGIASYIVFLIFNTNYPFSLAVLAGLLNFIPYIGPAITAILLFLIILPISAIKVFFVVTAFIIIQQIEGNILSPILMKKIIGLPPSLVLISLVIGAALWGVLGAILVIPLVGILFEFLKDFLQKKRERESVVL